MKVRLWSLEQRITFLLQILIMRLVSCGKVSIKKSKKVLNKRLKLRVFQPFFDEKNFKLGRLHPPSREAIKGSG